MGEEAESGGNYSVEEPPTPFPSTRVPRAREWLNFSRQMHKFKSVGQAQKFLAASELIYQYTQLKRPRLPALMTRHVMLERMLLARGNWDECSCLEPGELFFQANCNQLFFKRFNFTIPRQN